jgi:filamentous hemagglutinin family protein
MLWQAAIDVDGTIMTVICMRQRRFISMVCAILLGADFASSAFAGTVVTDGSVGAAMTLAGPNFSIPASLGRQVGPNLFQSFSNFQLAPGDVATFSGPNAGPAVTNIFARVTGGTLSQVNGTIQSTVPNANFYFINPAGVAFGASANLDVKGSFIVSTANVVKLADGGSFNASHPADSVLTSAAPAAFGFLGKPLGANGVNGQGPIDVLGETAAQGGISSQLQVPDGQSISLIGGDVIIINGILIAPSGNINIASVRGSGDVKVNPADPSAIPDTSGVSGLGFVGLEQGTLDVDGAPAGRIAIRGASLFLEDNSEIASITTGGPSAGGIDIALTGALTLLPTCDIGAFTESATSAGPVNISAGSVTLNNSASNSSEPTIQDKTLGSGNAGDLSIKTTTLTLDGESEILEGSQSSGNTGAMQIQANTINISGDHAFIGSISTLSSGAGSTGAVNISTEALSFSNAGEIFVENNSNSTIGSVNITAASIECTGELSGISIHGTPSNPLLPELTIKTNSLDLNQDATIDTATFGANVAGTMSISVNQLTLESSATITASAAETSTGNAGDINISANTIALDSAGTINSLALGSGSAGNIFIHANQLTLTNQGEIGTLTGGAGGAGGNISVDVAHLTATTGGFLNAATIDSGNGGNIDITADHIFFSDLGSGVKAPTVVTGADGVSGNGGTVNIHASTLTIENGAEIRTSAEGRADDGSIDPVAEATGTSGPAGNINLDVNRITLSGNADAQAEIISQTALQEPGTGPAGGISITSKKLTVLAGGAIDTNSSGPGNAGQINIRAGRFVLGQFKGAAESASVTSTGTGAGNAGSVLIRTPGSFTLRSGGAVQVSATESTGGDITIDGGDSLSVSRGLISASSSATGGNITLRADSLINIDHSTITAQAGGNGGKILIDPTDVVLNSSTINGLSGGVPVIVKINSDGFLQNNSRILTDTHEEFPVTDIAGSIANLGTDLVSGAAQLEPDCAVRFTGQNISSFIVTGRGGEPPEPGAWVPDLSLQLVPEKHW